MINLPLMAVSLICLLLRRLLQLLIGRTSRFRGSCPGVPKNSVLVPEKYNLLDAGDRKKSGSWQETTQTSHEKLCFGCGGDTMTSFILHFIFRENSPDNQRNFTTFSNSRHT